eukprot:m.91286 g.91286  ORF g.91286 m.91286 type:complete len:338 (-) comp14905_c0_seq2:261-1274(-)
MYDDVVPPLVARQLDMLELVWPSDATSDRPQVQRYCLMGPQGAYTDFHVDLGGTSVWYHVVKGCKVFYLIPPSEQNLAAFEAWSSATKQSQICFADKVPACYECRVEAGNTLLIPSGWIHAVYTPIDSFVFGGNYLHTLGLDMQLKVYDLEAKLSVETTFRYPSFRYLHWHLGNYLAKLPAEKVHELTTTGNLQALVAALNAWKSPNSLSEEEGLPIDVDVVTVVQKLRETLIELRHRYVDDEYPVQSWQRATTRIAKPKLLPSSKPSAKRPNATAVLPAKRPRKKEAPKLKINTDTAVVYPEARVQRQLDCSAHYRFEMLGLKRWIMISYDSLMLK